MNEKPATILCQPCQERDELRKRSALSSPGSTLDDYRRTLCDKLKRERDRAVSDLVETLRNLDDMRKQKDDAVRELKELKTLCDNLRSERDRAVSDLAEALRNLDDMRKQKDDAVRELKELKCLPETPSTCNSDLILEKMENQLEKEARVQLLVAHSSQDSAIDTDSLEWETEVVEFEKDREDMDLKALGFDVAEGEPYLPGDCGIFVTKVDKGSIADGRLRVNDWLLKINDVDLTNKDKKQVIKAVLNGGGVVNMVVCRRKSLGGKVTTPLHVNLVGHKDSGIGLENGVFVDTVVPGSPAAKEGSLAVGDRIIAKSTFKRPRTPRMGIGALHYAHQPSTTEAFSLMKVQKCIPAREEHLSRPSSIRLASSSITLKYGREGVKIPWTPKFPKTGSNRV